MFLFSTWALRLSGLIGILGAIIFICGDLLYNHIPGSSAAPVVKMGKMPEARLINAGTAGLFGCWLYVLAGWQIYIAFRSVGEIFALILFIAFEIVMICYGIVHTAYFSIAAGAQVAGKAGLDAEIGGKLGSTFNQRLVNITYIPVAVVSLMMLYGIVTGQSLYPRWMIVFLPVIIYLLKIPVVRILRGRLRELVNDSYDNMVLFVFYLLSTIVLWNRAIM